MLLPPFCAGLHADLKPTPPSNNVSVLLQAPE